MNHKLPRVIVLLVVLTGAVAWWFGVAEKLGWRRSAPSHLTLFGNIDIRQVQLGFRVSGRVSGLLVDEGDRVKAGQVLARLDAQPYQDAFESAAAEVARETATLAKLKAGPRAAEIAQARAQVAERAADFLNAEQAFGRAQRLLPNANISQAAFDQTHATKNMAAARLSSAREALRLLEEGTRPEDIAAADAALKAAQAKLTSAQTSLNDTQLRAPEDGMVLSRVREQGAIISPSDIVYVLSLEKPVWARAYITEPDLGRIHPGKVVEVLTDTAPERPYRGRIGFISPVAEFTPKSVETTELRTDLVYRLRVIIDEPDEALRQGMPVTVRIPSNVGAEGGRHGP